MEKLRVAAVGAGYFSQFQYDAWSRIPEVQVVGVCDQDTSRAREVAKRHGGWEVYSDVLAMLEEARADVLDIITPPSSHLALIRLAAERGVNVICQKPFCKSLEEARQAAALAEQAGIELIVHENVRFQPWYEELQRQIAAGRLGQIYQATFRLRPGDGQGPQAYLERQPYFQKMERFLIHETGIHWIDTFRYLFGEVSAVYAELRRLNPAIAGEDAGHVIMECAGGVRAVLDGNRLSDHCAENRRLTMGEMTIEGSEGVLVLRGDGTLGYRRHGENLWQDIDYEWMDHGFGGDCVYRFSRHVVDGLMGRSRLANTASDYLANMNIEEAVYTSAREGRRLRVSSDVCGS